MTSKVNNLKKAWQVYVQRAKTFNSEFFPEHVLATPDLDKVKRIHLEDSFWNMGQLTHPDEAWEVDPNVQKGIEAYPTLSHCQDELRLIACKGRQAVKWAITWASQLDQIFIALSIGKYLNSPLLVKNTSMYTIRSTSNPCPENQPTDVLTENQE
jgi:hypothetical protein